MSIVLYMIDKARSVERKVHLVDHFTHQTLLNGDDIKHNIIHLQEMLISDCTASEVGVHSMPSQPTEAVQLRASLFQEIPPESLIEEHSNGNATASVNFSKI